MFDVMEEIAPKMLVAQGLLLVVALALLVGGVLLLMRRRIAGLIIQTWAVLKIIAGGFAAYMSWQMMIQVQSGMFEKIAAGSPSGGRSVMDTMSIIYQVGYFLYFLWLMTLPVLFLIWLNRDAIKDDLRDGVWK